MLDAPVCTLRECDCPAYVARCAHRGDLRIWLILTVDAVAEFERRTGEPFPGGRCDDCRLGLPAPNLRAAIYGPGRFDPRGPDCGCYAELAVSADRLWTDQIHEGDDLEAMFEAATRRLIEVADAE